MSQNVNITENPNQSAIQFDPNQMSCMFYEISLVQQFDVSIWILCSRCECANWILVYCVSSFCPQCVFSEIITCMYFVLPYSLTVRQKTSYNKQQQSYARLVDFTIIHLIRFDVFSWCMFWIYSKKSAVTCGSIDIFMLCILRMVYVPQ